jgi:hypothetical protein
LEDWRIGGLEVGRLGGWGVEEGDGRRGDRLEDGVGVELLVVI